MEDRREISDFFIVLFNNVPRSRGLRPEAGDLVSYRKFRLIPRHMQMRRPDIKLI